MSLRSPRPPPLSRLPLNQLFWLAKKRHCFQSMRSSVFNAYLWFFFPVPESLLPISKPRLFCLYSVYFLLKPACPGVPRGIVLNQKEPRDVCRRNSAGPLNAYKSWLSPPLHVPLNAIWKVTLISSGKAKALQGPHPSIDVAVGAACCTGTSGCLGRRVSQLCW